MYEVKNKSQSVISRLRCVDFMLWELALLTRLSSNVSLCILDMETPSSSVSVNYPWLSLRPHTAITPVTSTSTQSHTFIIAVDYPTAAWAQATKLCHTSRARNCSSRSSPNPCPALRHASVLLSAHCSGKFPPNSLDSCSKLSITLIPLSSLFHLFWREAKPCRSGRLGVSGPELTGPIGGRNRDLTSKKKGGLQLRGRLRLEEQWESHRAAHCFSTTLFRRLSGLFFLKPKSCPALAKPS